MYAGTHACVGTHVRTHAQSVSSTGMGSSDDGVLSGGAVADSSLCSHGLGQSFEKSWANQEEKRRFGGGCQAMRFRCFNPASCAI